MGRALPKLILLSVAVCAVALALSCRSKIDAQSDRAGPKAGKLDDPSPSPTPPAAKKKDTSEAEASPEPGDLSSGLNIQDGKTQFQSRETVTFSVDGDVLAGANSFSLWNVTT